VSVPLYMDVHVHQAITAGLRLRGVDVLTAQEDGARQLSDSGLLDRATALGRVLFSQDEDLLREATRRQQSRESFAGVIYAH
jgi:predicted nuclease of predicted toxin-antitoxin system